MYHQQQVLKTMILIGNNTNDYILDIIRTQFNPLSFVYLDKLIPNITFKEINIGPKYNGLKFIKSGFKV